MDKTIKTNFLTDDESSTEGHWKGAERSDSGPRAAAAGVWKGKPLTPPVLPPRDPAGVSTNVLVSGRFSRSAMSCWRSRLKPFWTSSRRADWKSCCWRGSWRRWRKLWKRRRLSSAPLSRPPTSTKLQAAAPLTDSRYDFVSTCVQRFVFTQKRSVLMVSEQPPF